MKLGILVKALVLASALGSTAMASAKEIPASPAWLHDKLVDAQKANPYAKIIAYKQERDGTTQYFISITDPKAVDLQSELLDQDGKQLCAFGGIAKQPDCQHDYKPKKADKVVWTQSGGKMKPGGVDHVPVKPASGA